MPGFLGIHPGEILAEELEERSVTGAAAARALGIPQSRVSNILRGRTGITADTALRLGRWLGTGPELWLNMQKDYELRLAESQHGNDIRSTVAPMAQPVPPN
jgi:addiction module HigA family antidote